MSGKKSADHAGDHQYRKIPNDLRCPGKKDRHEDLPDVMKDRADHAQEPETFERKEWKDQGADGKAEKPSAKTVRKGHDPSAHESAQDDARDQDQQGVFSSIKVKNGKRNDISQPHFYAGHGSERRKAGFYDKNDQGNGCQHAQVCEAGYSLLCTVHRPVTASSACSCSPFPVKRMLSLWGRHTIGSGPCAWIP